jgi:dihydropteroate synthase
MHADRGLMRLRGRALRWGARTYLMAIVNVTPDSFSGDGRADAAAAVEHAVYQWRAGADMLDIGGESTRPGHTPVDEATELKRVIPVIAAVRERLPDAIVSVDTYKPAVARAAHDAGADVLNSVWGLPEELLDVACERAMPVVAMHNREGTHDDRDVTAVVAEYLSSCARRAVERGMPAEHVILDPGIGFGKNADQNLELLRNLRRITALGFPTLLGTSRKSTIGKLTGRDPAERVYGTAATTALAIAAGVDIIRVHDVAAQRDAISVSDAIVRDWRPDGWTG